MFNNLKWLWFKRKINKKNAGSLSDDYQGKLTQILSLFETTDITFDELPYKYIDKTLQLYCQHPSFREPVKSLARDIIDEATAAMMLEVEDTREPLKKLWSEYELVEHTRDLQWWFIASLDRKTALSPYFPTYETLKRELKFLYHMYTANIFKCRTLRRLPDCITYAKIMVSVLADEDILAIYEETYNEYRKGN
jgi:hypothetical protein